MGDILGLVYLGVGIGLLFAIFRLFSIEKSLKAILAELQLQRTAAGRLRQSS
jgi:hypothetical protein